MNVRIVFWAGDGEGEKKTNFARVCRLLVRLLLLLLMLPTMMMLSLLMPTVYSNYIAFVCNHQHRRRLSLRDAFEFSTEILTVSLSASMSLVPFVSNRRLTFCSRFFFHRVPRKCQNNIVVLQRICFSRASRDQTHLIIIIAVIVVVSTVAAVAVGASEMGKLKWKTLKYHRGMRPRLRERRYCCVCVCVCGHARSRAIV